MYLLKFQLENNTESVSLYQCLNSEVRDFEHRIEMMKLEHPNESFFIASKNEVLEFKNADELMERCEFIKLEDEEYKVISKLRIGFEENAAQKVFESVRDEEITYEQTNGMEMGM